MAVEPLRSVNITESTRWNFAFTARSSSSRCSRNREMSWVSGEPVSPAGRAVAGAVGGAVCGAFMVAGPVAGPAAGPVAGAGRRGRLRAELVDEEIGRGRRLLRHVAQDPASPFGDGLGALLLVGLQGPGDRVEERAGVPLVRAGQRVRDGVDLHAGERVGRVLAGHRVEEDAAERVDVRPRPLLGLRRVLLEGGVPGRDEGGQRALGAADRVAGGAEVDEDGLAVGPHEDVVGLDVAVQETRRVDLADAVEEQGEQRLDRLLRREGVLLQPGLERLAVLVVHHHVAGAVGLEVAVDPDDVGMAEAGQRARLLEEAVQARLVVLGALRVGQRDGAVVHARHVARGEVLLDRHVLLEVRVAREVGDAEPADAQDGHELVLHEHGVQGKGVGVLRLRHGVGSSPDVTGPPVRAGNSGLSGRSERKRTVSCAPIITRAVPSHAARRDLRPGGVSSPPRRSPAARPARR